MCSYCDTWLSASESHQFTRGGHLKAPSCSLLCELVKSSWDAVPIDIVKKPFASCAINIPTDGSRDSEIHCFREGQHCAAGMSLLQQKMKSYCLLMALFKVMRTLLQQVLMMMKQRQMRLVWMKNVCNDDDSNDEKENEMKSLMSDNYINSDDHYISLAASTLFNSVNVIDMTSNIKF